MNRLSKKMLVAIILILLMTAGVFATANTGDTSMAETDTYTLAISDIIEIQDLTVPKNADEESISLYTLPVGATITLTTKSEGIRQTINCYDENNQIIESFSMGADGISSPNEVALAGNSTVYYNVTAKDQKWLFMSIDIIEDGKTTSFFFLVSSTEEESPEEKSIAQNVELIVTAKPTDAKVLINGEVQAFQAYEINNYNYFMLRDIAQAISGTGKQFEVDWDGEKDAISLNSGRPYTTQGGELQASTDLSSKTGMATQSTIILDGQEVSFVAYLINDNNYFKLRDLGQAIDFAVIWDGTTSTITIDTQKGYQ